MAYRSVRVLTPALEGVPYRVDELTIIKEHHGLYGVEVELAVEDFASLRGRERSLVRSRATVVIEEQSAEATVFHGLIAARAQHRRAGFDGAILSLMLRPRVWVLDTTCTAPSHRGLSVREALVRTLATAGLNEGEDILLPPQDERWAREATFRLGESDLAFLCRVCDELTLRLSFRQSAEREVMVLSDRG